MSQCTHPPWWRHGYWGLAMAFGSRACQTTAESEYPLDLGTPHSCTVKFMLKSSLCYFFNITRNFYFLFFQKNNLFLAILVEMSDFREGNGFNRSYNPHLWILDWSHLFFGCCKWSQTSRNTISSNIDAESVGSFFVEHGWYKACEQGWEAVIASKLLHKRLLSVHCPLCWSTGPGPEGAMESKTAVPGLTNLTATTGVREGRLFTQRDDSFCCKNAGQQTLLNQWFETT